MEINEIIAPLQTIRLMMTLITEQAASVVYLTSTTRVLCIVFLHNCVTTRLGELRA